MRLLAPVSPGAWLAGAGLLPALTLPKIRRLRDALGISADVLVGRDPVSM